jgi:hypothetical protein
MIHGDARMTLPRQKLQQFRAKLACNGLGGASDFAANSTFFWFASCASSRPERCFEFFL